MRIALVGNDDFSIWHFRRGLILALLARGHLVTVVCPSGEYRGKIESLGVKFVDVAMPRFMSPINDLILLFGLWRLFRRERFDLIHTMTIKPNIYGTVAGWLVGVPLRVSLVSGLGFMFSGSEGSGLLSRKVAKMLYRFALGKSHRTWFQNPDDLEKFRGEGIVRPGRGIVILGSGIDLDEFSKSSVPQQEVEKLRMQLGIKSEARTVLLVAARLIWSKGIKEFVETAGELKAKFPDWRFVLLAPREEGSPDSVPDSYVAGMNSGNICLVTSFQKEVRPFYAMADIMTLPSFYPEGVPRSILEAMAFGLPIVTTNLPGCRETVVEGENGFLIPPNSSADLTERLSRLMNSEEMRQRFGQKSRELAAEKFSQSVVIEAVLSDLYGLESKVSLAASSEQRKWA